MNQFFNAVERLNTYTEKSTFDILQGKCGHVNGFVFVQQACCFVCPQCGDMYMEDVEEGKTE